MVGAGVRSLYSFDYFLLTGGDVFRDDPNKIEVLLVKPRVSWLFHCCPGSENICG